LENEKYIFKKEIYHLFHERIEMDQQVVDNKIGKKVWTLLLVVWVSMAVSQILTFSYGMMLPQIMDEFKLDYAAIGLVGSVVSIVGIFTTIPLVLMSKNFKVKYTIPVILLFSAVGVLIFGSAQNLTMLFVGNILFAVVGSALSATLVLYKIKNVPQSRIGEINGIENFIGPIGQVIATLFMAQILILVDGWRNVYYIVAALMAVCAVLWFVLFKEKKTSPETAAKEKSGTKIKALRDAIKVPSFWLFAIGWPGTTIVWIAMFYYWPTYAQTTRGLSAAQSGLVLSFIPIFSALASLVAPRITRKVGVDKPFIWIWGFLLPVFYFCMLQTSNVFLLCLASAAAGFGAYFFVPLAFTLLYKLGLHPQVVAIGTAMIMTGVAVGSAAGSGIIGALITAFDGDIYKTLAISCLTPLLWGILTLFVPERGRKWMEKAMAKK
jgi:predicted MFS family arabinose efflux permease